MAPSSQSQHKKHPHSNTPHYTMMTRALAAAQVPIRPQQANSATPIENVEAVIGSLLKPHPRDVMLTESAQTTAMCSSPLGSMIRQAFYSHAVPPMSWTPASTDNVIDFRRSRRRASV